MDSGRVNNGISDFSRYTVQLTGMIDISKKYLFGVNVAKIYKHAEMRAKDIKNRHINQQLGEPNNEGAKG